MIMMTASNFNLNRFAEIQTIAKAIAKVHECANAYILADEAEKMTDYQIDYYAWEKAIDNRDKAEASLRTAIRSYFKMMGSEPRDKWNGKKLNGREGCYMWAKTFNDSLSEYSTYNRLSWETLDLLNMVRKATDCELYLNCD